VPQGDIAGDNLELKDNYIYLMNKRNIVFLKGLDTLLRNSGRVAIFSPV